MTDLKETIKIFGSRNAAGGILSDGKEIRIEKITSDRFGWPRYLVHYSSVGLTSMNDNRRKATSLKRYQGKKRGPGLLVITSFDIVGDLEAAINIIKDTKF